MIQFATALKRGRLNKLKLELQKAFFSKPGHHRCKVFEGNPDYISTNL
jgi:hypothetical protein